MREKIGLIIAIVFAFFMAFIAIASWSIGTVRGIGKPIDDEQTRIENDEYYSNL